MNIIFLDIDGVLNSVDSMIGYGMSYPKEEPTDTGLDPVRVGLLKYIYNQIDDVAIYVHSSWAKKDHVDNEYVIKMLAHGGFENANVLPIDKERAMLRRADRIHHTLDALKPDNYVIYDDVDMTNEFGEKSIWINPTMGISEYNLHETKKIFPDLRVPIVLL